MSQQYTPNLGEVPDETAKRDAVHIAVAPVIAGEILSPGQRVGLGKNGRVVGVNNIGVKDIGIVDPFLRVKEIQVDQSCWLFLYPNTVTSLRHVWSHSAFSAQLGGQS